MGQVVFELPVEAMDEEYRPKGRRRVDKGECSRRALERLRGIIKQRRIPMDKFGREALGLGLDATRNMVQGRSELTVDRLDEIARYLDVPYNFFVREDGDEDLTGLSVEEEAHLALIRRLSPRQRRMLDAIAVTFEQGGLESETAPE